MERWVFRPPSSLVSLAVYNLGRGYILTCLRFKCSILTRRLVGCRLSSVFSAVCLLLCARTQPGDSPHSATIHFRFIFKIKVRSTPTLSVGKAKAMFRQAMYGQLDIELCTSFVLHTSFSYYNKLDGMDRLF